MQFIERRLFDHINNTIATNISNIMQKHIFTLTLALFLMGVFVPKIAAQNAADTNIERAQLPANTHYITDFNFAEPGSASSNPEPIKKELDDLQKTLMQQMTEIYELHIQAVRNQINDDPVAAEENITSALKAVQQMLEDYPEIQGNERFTELYRTVYTEYRSFYGIEEVDNREKGKIFAVQRDLYNSSSDWMRGHYVLPENITKPETEVPLIYDNEHVNQHLRFYSSKRPEVMQRWLERSKKYFPMMERIFQEEGVPTELIHLSMIESGLNPKARSWASAVGMWQFIRPTGAAYGLEANWWLDERRDPEKATRAAARHLKDLYETWGDWYLAIANYNISPRGLKRAIRAGGGTKDYWSAYPHLPRETQGYIPGFIATTIINRNAEAFGFNETYEVEPYSYDVVEVAPLMSLKKLAEAANMSLEKLKDYNPELLRWATPPGGNYQLKLPEGNKNSFLANYQEIPKNKRSQGVAVHRVSRGETLGYIARKYGSSVRGIYETNEGLSSTIHPGQKIIVPLAPGSSPKIAAQTPNNDDQKESSSASSRSDNSSSDNGKSKILYTVKSGDTVGHIAEWFDVQSSQVRAWNNTSNTINVGETLTIYVSDAKEGYYGQVNSFSASKKRQIEREQDNGKDVTSAYLADAGSGGAVRYTVRKSDTLIEIARTFDVSVSDIKRTNNLNGSRIYEGQRLRINHTN